MVTNYCSFDTCTYEGKDISLGCSRKFLKRYIFGLLERKPTLWQCPRSLQECFWSEPRVLPVTARSVVEKAFPHYRPHGPGHSQDLLSPTVLSFHWPHPLHMEDFIETCNEAIFQCNQNIVGNHLFVWNQRSRRPYALKDKLC